MTNLGPIVRADGSDEGWLGVVYASRRDHAIRESPKSHPPIPFVSVLKKKKMAHPG
jgi:hypothetical protein